MLCQHISSSQWHVRDIPDSRTCHKASRRTAPICALRTFRLSAVHLYKISPQTIVMSPASPRMRSFTSLATASMLLSGFYVSQAWASITPDMSPRACGTLGSLFCTSGSCCAGLYCTAQSASCTTGTYSIRFSDVLFRFASRAGSAEPSATMLTSPVVRPAEQTEDRSIARRPR
jgi:hypothetical protein